MTSIEIKVTTPKTAKEALDCLQAAVKDLGPCHAHTLHDGLLAHDMGDENRVRLALEAAQKYTTALMNLGAAEMYLYNKVQDEKTK